MSFHLPDYIDELIDGASDPLCILLAREGSNDEAYQTAVFHRSGQQQVVSRALIEQRPGEDEGDVSIEVVTRVPRSVRISRITKKSSFN